MQVLTVLDAVFMLVAAVGGVYISHLADQEERRDLRRIVAAGVLWVAAMSATHSLATAVLAATR
jgi:hypothetical protein